MPAIEIEEGMNILDAAIISGGSLEDLFAFATLNGLSFTSDVVTGASLQATGLSYQASTAPIAYPVTFKPVLVMDGQTLLDMAMQQLGSIEAWFDLAKLNNISYTADLQNGQMLNYSITPYNTTVQKIFQDKGYKPSSGDSIPGQTLPVQPEGIGYWIVGTQFKVS